MKTTCILIRSDGTIQTVGDLPPEFRGIGIAKRKRMSHVLPCNKFKRAAFIALRALFGERGVVASWTRTWVGPWESVLIPTGERFTAFDRADAIEWERTKLETMLEN